MAASAPTDTYVDVVVVGAGVSGLRAASELQNTYRMNVMVLEARDKYGG
jgi:monoamine oxidase